MGTAAVLGVVLQLVQAGFQLEAIVAEAQQREAAGATDQEIHDWLFELAETNQKALESA